MTIKQKIQTMTLAPYKRVYHLLSTLMIDIYMLGLRFKLESIGRYCRIYFADIIEPYNVSIGHHVYINKNCTISSMSGKIKIGNYVMIGPNVTFIGQNHDFSDWQVPMIFTHDRLAADIVIEDDVWIGANVCILPGVTVKKGAIVAAGAIVNRDVAPYTIVGGVPAKKLKSRVVGSLLRKAITNDLTRFAKKKIDWLSWSGGEAVNDHYSN